MQKNVQMASCGRYHRLQSDRIVHCRQCRQLADDLRNKAMILARLWTKAKKEQLVLSFWRERLGCWRRVLGNVAGKDCVYSYTMMSLIQKPNRHMSRGNTTKSSLLSNTIDLPLNQSRSILGVKRHQPPSPILFFDKAFIALCWAGSPECHSPLRSYREGAHHHWTLRVRLLDRDENFCEAGSTGFFVGSVLKLGREFYWHTTISLRETFHIQLTRALVD